MNKEHTMESYEFILKIVIDAVIICIWYYNIFFRCVDNMTYVQSSFILAGIFIGIASLCRFVLFQRRTEWCANSILLLSFGFYTILVYWKYLKQRFTILLIVSLVIASIYACLVMCRKIRNKKNKIIILRRRMYQCVVSTTSIVAVTMGVIMLPMLISGMFEGKTIVGSGIPVASKTKGESQTIAANIKELEMIRPNKWEKLSVQDKLDILQIIANIERDYLGLSHELRVKAANLDEVVLGCYDDRKHLIQINIDSLIEEDVDEIINTVCHEAYHAYQFSLCESYRKADDASKKLRIYKDVPEYIDNFRDYKEGTDCGYYEQLVEVKAREYGEDGAEEYLERVYEYEKDN